MPSEESLRPQDVPNLCGPHLGGLELWTRHRVSSKDTMAHLALKYGTTIGQICRANRMHWQDIPQTRRFIWVPAPGTPNSPLQNESLYQATPPPLESIPNYARVLTAPPHFYRQSAPNLDDCASDCDPLLITTRCM